jgi:hypothetical protein
MSNKRAGQLIARIEGHIGCWKQFNYFVSLARAKKFGPEDESHFLELKKIIGLDLEMIFAELEIPSPGREETAALLGRAPSLGCLGEMGGGDLCDLENAWHKIYVGWHSVLGRIAVSRRNRPASFFGGRR